MKTVSSKRILALFIFATLGFDVQSISLRTITLLKGLSKQAIFEELNRIGLSQPIREYNKKILNPFFSDVLKDHESKSEESFASKEYQQLGREAQSKVGIPRIYQLPVTLAKNEFGNGAATYPHKIRLQGNFDLRSSETKKFIMHHEAIHAKYCHFAINSLLFIPTEELKKGYESLTNERFFLPDVKCHGFSLQELSSVIPLNTLSQFHEKCADTEAAYSLDCHKCLEATLNIRSKKTSTEPKDLEKLNGGYLSYEEILNIVNDLKSKNRLCDYHRFNREYLNSLG